jgi:hypothetical protein
MGRFFVYFQNGNIGIRGDFAAVFTGFLTFQLAEFFTSDVEGLVGHYDGGCFVDW